MDELQLTVEVNGEKRTYSPEMTYREIAEEYQKDYPAKIILAKVDGRLRELTKKAENGSRVSFVTVQDKAGYSTYCRSVELLMLKAIYHVVGDNRKIDRDSFMALPTQVNRSTKRFFLPAPVQSYRKQTRRSTVLPSPGLPAEALIRNLTLPAQRLEAVCFSSA